MGLHRRTEALSFVLLACIPLHYVCDAHSTFQKVSMPENPIRKENHPIKKGGLGALDWETGERNRMMKSGKDHKASKKSKKSKKYDQSYYENSYYTSSYPPPKRPVPSPTYGPRPIRKRVHDYFQPTEKPVSYHDPIELSEYKSYSDMVDYYYIKQEGGGNSVDEPIGPFPIVPTLLPIQRPDMDSSVWSFSEDEMTTTPTSAPTDLPSIESFTSFAPSIGQCMVRVMLDQCSSLLQSIEPREGCDCYNFCGGIYLGCCAINEPCPLTCEVLAGFVAGCRFGYTSSPVSVNPLTSDAPSISPSTKQISSEEPTLPGTFPTSGTSTGTPEPSEAISSPTPSPEQILPPTSLPISDILSIPLELFTLEYEVAFLRSIAQSDLVVLTSITNSYLQVYMSGAFQSDSIVMVDFETEYYSFLEDAESSVVLVTFRSTAFFDPRTRDLPSKIDLERELATAFQGMALSGYLGRVQALPASNAFSKTSEIFLVQNPPTITTLESKEFSTVAAATVIFAATIVISLAGFSWYRTRRRRRRLEASDHFLQNHRVVDYAKEYYSRKRKDEDKNTGSEGGEEKLSITLLDEIERIEDLRRDIDYNSEDPERIDIRNISPRSNFENDESNLFEDDTIEDDEYD